MAQLRLFECLLLVGATALGLGVLEYFTFSSFIARLAGDMDADEVIDVSFNRGVNNFGNEVDEDEVAAQQLEHYAGAAAPAPAAEPRNASSSNALAGFSSGSAVADAEVDAGEFWYDFRGWHPDARRREYSAAVTAGLKVADSERLSYRPYQFPELEDPGTSYLAFDESLVLPEWQREPRLVYDITVIRLRDAFGLIDDEIPRESWEDIFRRIIAIYARYNIYLRVSREELANSHMLDAKRSLDYLAYVEGPDLAESVVLGSQRPAVSFKSSDVTFAKWMAERYRKVYGFPLLESASKLPKGLKTLGANGDKYNFQRNMLEWIVGYPMRIPPWNLVNSSPIFPVFYFHMRNGECYSGRLFGRTGSCAERRKPIIDPDTGTFLRNATCRRFENTLKSRAARPVQVRAHESAQLRGNAAARLFAHELGHNFGEHHPSDGCTYAASWEKGNLMHQLRNVGLREQQSCSETPVAGQHLATWLSEEQAARIRDVIRKVDIRPSRPVPGAETVGKSTMQLGSASRHVTDVLRRNRRAYVSQAFEVVRKAPCTLHQDLIVLNLMPAPSSGRVARLRWMPAHPYTRPFPIEVYVVEPRGTASLRSSASEMASFAIKQRSGPIVVPHKEQWTHRELDLGESGLRIEKGQLVALARLDGHDLDIDQAQYASAAALFSDVAGSLGSYYDTIHDALSPEHLPDSTTYPRLANAPKRADAFYFSAQPPVPGKTSFQASRAPSDFRASWCAQLLVNYDLQRS